MATAMMASTAAVKRAWLSQPRPWPTPPNFLVQRDDDNRPEHQDFNRFNCSPILRQQQQQQQQQQPYNNRTLQHSPSPGLGGMEVRCLDQGNSVKVRAADSGPHLVSLGSGRLSTNITLIPLPEGRLLMGCGGSYVQRQPDVVVQGTGVEPIHCYIETCSGAVQLYPLGEMTSVDGQRVNSPVRLIQGSMICIGRSNYFRFNHPEEAERMKTILPNAARISSVPMHFQQHNGHGHHQEPPGMDNPEYFHMAGASGNASPSSSAFQPVRSSSPQYIGEYLHPRTLTQFERDDDYQTVPNEGLASPVMPSSREQQQQQHQRWHSASPKVFPSNSSTVSLPASAVLGRGRSATPTAPVSSSASTFGVTVDHRRSHSIGASPAALQRQKSLEALAACEEQLEERRRKAQRERLREQEQEREERARLDEILQMCAEYQRQIDTEQQATRAAIAAAAAVSNGKPPPSPGHSLHPNRIKTNGSLPRERRLQSPQPANGSSTPSRHLLNSSEDELSGIFTFDSSSSHLHHNQQQQQPAPVSPGVAMESVLLSTTSSVSAAVNSKSPYENVAAAMHQQPPVSPVAPGSPRTRIRTTLQTPAVNFKETNGTTSSTSSSASSSSSSYPTYQLITSGVAAEAAKREAGRLEQECRQIECIVSALKNHVTDVEHQIDEAVREAEMERALLQGEVTAQLEKIQQDEKYLEQLQMKERRLGNELDAFRAEEGYKIHSSKTKMEQVEKELNRLEEQLDGFNGTTDEETLLLERVKLQHELLDTERKSFEDLEFRLMEHVAQREAERDELHHEMAGVEVRLLQRRGQLRDVEQQQRQASESARDEAEQLSHRRRQLFHQIEQEKAKLFGLQKKLEQLFQAGLTNGTSDDVDAYNGEANSSDTEESGTDIEHKLQELRQLGHSQDDLERISRISRQNRALTNTDDQGVKATATLMEIERQRQLMLVQQGTQVLEYERKKVAELKKRVQDQVRLQWEERKQQSASMNNDRETNCHSLNSVGSSEESRSSLTGSDAPTESMGSDTAATTPGPDGCSTTGSTAPSASITSILEVKVRQKEHHDSSFHSPGGALLLDESRPMSEASSFGGDETILGAGEVRLRNSRQMQQMQQQQRPLTRYLPVRADGFDLRQHIETAGHQVELCPHVALTSTSARGYLHKMGSRFRTWNKRWFVFDRVQRTFLYFADKTETRKRSGAYFQAIEEVYVDHLQSVRSPNPKLTFCVKTRERTYHLMAPSAEAMRIWVDVIFTGAEGYQQFHT